MAGPADYMRITGPLGGANFLSAAEYDAINPSSVGNRTLATMQQGANLGNTLANTKGQVLQNQAKQIEIDDAVQKKADQGAIIDVLVDARNARLPQAEPAPAIQPQQVAPMAIPQAAPAVPQAMPAPQAAEAMPAPAAPAPQAAAPAPQATTAAPQAAALPPTTAAPAPAAKGPLTQARDFLARAGETESDYQKDIKRVQDRLGKGELTPRVAQLSLDALRARRDTETARDTKYAENLDKLQTQFAEGKVTRKEANLKLADLNRNQKYDLAQMVLNDLSTAGPAQARQTAAENDLNPDEYINADGQPTAKLKNDAEKSAEAKARAKVLAEEKKADEKAKAAEAKANQVKWSFDKDTGLSTGVDPVTGASLIKDENGKAITTAQYRALDAAQRSAIAAAGRAPSKGGGSGGSGGGSAGSGEVTKPADRIRAVNAASKLGKEADVNKGIIDAANRTDTLFDQAEVLLKNTATGPIVGSGPVATARRLLPGGGNMQQLAKIQKDLTLSVVKALGANPSNADRAFIEELNNLTNMDNPAPFIARAREIVADKRATAQEALAENAMLKAETDRQLGIKRGDASPAPKAATPAKNAKGWALMKDAKGNMAYVGPRGEIEEVK